MNRAVIAPISCFRYVCFNLRLILCFYAGPFLYAQTLVGWVLEEAIRQKIKQNY
jgi:hypothetical protein